ncbi:hypothetical protein BDB01DRAFT_899227 [Pilobolus umbonatus]|nr:hypothetical protein BDB01DRAFT_899227 [Pilobolus umbonatus]
MHLYTSLLILLSITITFSMPLYYHTITDTHTHVVNEYPLLVQSNTHHPSLLRSLSDILHSFIRVNTADEYDKDFDIDYTGDEDYLTEQEYDSDSDSDMDSEMEDDYDSDIEDDFTPVDDLDYLLERDTHFKYYLDD